MSSTTLCGVCSQQPPRYKCPACQLPYCSLVCYKTHKPTHSTEDSQTGDSTNKTNQAIPSSTNNVDASTAAASLQPQPQPQPPIQARPNLQNVLTSPAITSLLSSNPNLQVQLRKIYTAMLPPSDPQSTYNSNTNTSNHNGGHHTYHNRGRGGRGRGRGGQYGQINDRKAPWTHDRAEEEALKMVGKLRGMEDEEGRLLEEFVKNVKEVVGGFEESPAPAEAEEEAAIVAT